MTRRVFLTALAAARVWGQTARPRLSIVWGSGAVPAAFAEEAVVFPRAYVSCPEATLAVRALERSRFPHALQGADASVWDYFERGTTAGEGITVWTSASSDGKDSPFDRSVRVPLAIRWPGVLMPHVANDVLMSHVDVMPTLLGLAGVAKPGGLQGRDVSDLLRGRAGEVPDAVFAEGALDTAMEWRILVRGFDKLIWNLKEEVVGLYNLADDPTEQRDLREEREGRLTRDSMLALAQQWMLRLEDGRDAHGLRLRRPE
ncbi:MAG: sulfatase/phosphatase domain-containing protein [Acidobacteriota bacterium]